MKPKRKRKQKQKRTSVMVKSFEKAKVWIAPISTLLALTTLFVWGGFKLQDPTVMPVRTVGVDGEMRFLQRKHLEQVVAKAVNGSFLSLDLPRMRQRIELIPWVENVTIRRVWPDTLRVQVTERTPLAYWGEDAMVSVQGEIFKPEVVPHIDGLVHLVGEPQHAKMIIQEFQHMSSLLEMAGLELTSVWVDARQSWRVKMKSGLQVQLGRREVMPRLMRFVQIYPSLNASQKDRQLESVDLRYTNGFAVHWRPAEEQVSQRINQSMWMYGSGMLSRTNFNHQMSTTTGESRG
jgi:cell division protein FtsQ